MANFPAGLIGSTGFVGSNLLQQAGFDLAVHRSDVERLTGNHFDLLVCAGAPAEKWRANADPPADRANLERLVEVLAQTSAERFVLISSVDVYPSPIGVDELTAIDPTAGGAYGRHRLWLEQRCRELFPSLLIVRLPGMFGPGLKKNFLFDLLAGKNVYLTHSESWFQFYDVRRLWQDLQTALGLDLHLVNLATPPMKAAGIAQEHFGIDFTNLTARGPVRYDMQTIHADEFGGKGHYLLSEDQVRGGLAAWIRSSRSSGTMGT